MPLFFFFHFEEFKVKPHYSRLTQSNLIKYTRANLNKGHRKQMLLKKRSWKGEKQDGKALFNR